MISGGGHRKGSRFERQVARDLSLWVSDGTRDDVFWRSAMSGGRATIGLRDGLVRSAMAGDISAVSAMGEALLAHVVVECKSYAELDLFSGVANDAGKLHRFWHELVKHAAKFQRQPMLVARQNGMPTVCLVTPAVTELLELTVDHVSAVLPRWGCHLILFDCLLREAAPPRLEIELKPRRRAVLA